MAKISNVFLSVVLGLKGGNSRMSMSLLWMRSEQILQSSSLAWSDSSKKLSFT